MRAIKLSRENRALLASCGVTRPRFMLRWAGELSEDGVLTALPDGRYRLAAGCCGHYSFFRLRILLHRHPGDLNVPEDMQAALRGEAPVPDWFRSGG